MDICVYGSYAYTIYNVYYDIYVYLCILQCISISIPTFVAAALPAVQQTLLSCRLTVSPNFQCTQAIQDDVHGFQAQTVALHVSY